MAETTGALEALRGQLAELVELAEAVRRAQDLAAITRQAADQAAAGALERRLDLWILRYRHPKLGSAE